MFSFSLTAFCSGCTPVSINSQHSDPTCSEESLPVKAYIKGGTEFVSVSEDFDSGSSEDSISGSKSLKLYVRHCAL